MPPLPAHRVAGLYLARRVRFGMKLGLETMRALVAEMGHPERAYPSLLIAGTNGKGSVAAYCDAALRASGLRTGRYTSPHLVRVNERITVDGREITDHDFAIAVRAVRDAAERLVRRGVLEAHPTFFEVMTAAAFAHFRRKRVDVAVLEAGLGGRLDATNVVEPIASAIVSIDFDHEVYLGQTLAAIAGEKAGVLREGRPTRDRPAARRGAPGRPRARACDRRARRRGAARRPLRPPRRLARPRRDAAGWPTSSICARRGPATRACGPCRARTSATTCSSRSGCWRRRSAPASRSTCGSCPARSRARAGPAASSGSPAIRRSSSTAPTTPPARAPSPRTLRGGPPFVLVFGAMSDKDVRGLAGELFPLAGRDRPHAAAHRARRDAGRARPPGRPPRRPRPPPAERRPRSRPGPTPRARARADDDGRGGGEPLPRGRGQGGPGARGRAELTRALSAPGRPRAARGR